MPPFDITSRLLQGAAWLEGALGNPVPSMLLKSGSFPPPAEEGS